MILLFKLKGFYVPSICSRCRPLDQQQVVQIAKPTFVKLRKELTILQSKPKVRDKLKRCLKLLRLTWVFTFALCIKTVHCSCFCVLFYKLHLLQHVFLGNYTTNNKKVTRLTLTNGISQGRPTGRYTSPSHWACQLTFLLAFFFYTWQVSLWKTKLENL